MPVEGSLPSFNKGDRLKAADLQALSNGIARSRSSPGTFLTGAFTVARKLAFGGSSAVEEVEHGLIVGEIDTEREIKSGAWDKADRRFEPPTEEEVDQGKWTIRVQKLAFDEDLNLVQQFAPDDAEEPTEMLPVESFPKYIDGERLKIPKSAQDMTHTFNEVNQAWDPKQPEEVEVYAFYCRYKNGLIEFINCRPFKILHAAPPVPEEGP